MDIDPKEQPVVTQVPILEEPLVTIEPDPMDEFKGAMAADLDKLRQFCSIWNKRELIAAMAMWGMLSRTQVHAIKPHELCAQAREFADLLLADLAANPAPTKEQKSP